MITIAYNERYGTLERLYFAGLDADNRPMWLTLKPGEPIVNTVNSERCWGRQVYCHLCLEGEEASASVIVRVLGLALEVRPGSFAMLMTETLRELRAMNVKWKKEPVELVFTVYDEGEEDDNRYHLTVRDGVGINMVTDAYFRTFSDTVLAVTLYLSILRKHAGIPITGLKLRAPKKLIANWKKKSPGAFNDYAAFEDESDDYEDRHIIDFV